jgi:hypothetical protein
MSKPFHIFLRPPSTQLPVQYMPSVTDCNPEREWIRALLINALTRLGGGRMMAAVRVGACRHNGKGSGSTIYSLLFAIVGPSQRVSAADRE